MCEVTILHLFYKWTTNELYVSSFNNSWSHLPQEFDLQCKQDSDQSSANTETQILDKKIDDDRIYDQKR